MKLLVIASLMLLLLGIVTSVPEDNTENSILNKAEEAELDDAEVMAEGDGEGDEDGNDSEDLNELDTAPLPEDGMETFQLESTSQGLQGANIQDNINNKGIIRHGDTIALQTFDRYYWASCAGRHCNRAGCPRMQMTGFDWKKCYGEVFVIYRARGPGAIRVGDRVGLYYPRDRKWLGCVKSICDKRTCPGHPHFKYGFSTPTCWKQCWGEVFRIYSKGRRNHSVILADQDVSLYYVRDRKWVAQGYSTKMDKRPCLGRRFPPPLHQYDYCPFETFTIWKKP